MSARATPKAEEGNEEGEPAKSRKTSQAARGRSYPPPSDDPRRAFAAVRIPRLPPCLGGSHVRVTQEDRPMTLDELKDQILKTEPRDWHLL